MSENQSTPIGDESARAPELPMQPSPGGPLKEEDELGFSRIVALTDGVFAIAITLLVLGIEPPKVSDAGLSAALADLGDQIWTYFFSFVVIGIFWVGHHAFFNQLRAYDTGLLWLNLFYLAFIGFLPFPTAVYGDHPGVREAVVLYAGSMAAAGIMDSLLFIHAWRRHLLKPEVELRLREVLYINLLVPTVFLVSIPVAFVDPNIAPFVWLVLAVVLIFRHARQRAAIRRATAAHKTIDR